MASTLSLLRVNVRSVRARYERIWRCLADNSVRPFDIDISSIEGQGSEAERISRLLELISSHEQLSDQHLRRIHVSKEAARRWHRANRGGGRLIRMMRDRDEAIRVELDLRKTNGELSLAPTIIEGDTSRKPVEDASARVDNSTAATTPKEIYPALYADDVMRINRQMDAEEAGVRKPNRNDRLVAARLGAYQRGNMTTVQSLDAQQARRSETKR